jgi:ATP-dependent Lon protease
VDYLAEALHELRRHNFTEALDREFGLGTELKSRDVKAIRKTVSGLIKLIYPHGEYSKEELGELLEFAMEGRRRVKEQLRRIGAFEFRNIAFKYKENKSGIEKEVFVPEEIQAPSTAGGTEQVVADDDRLFKLIEKGENATLEFKETLEADAETGKKHPSLIVSTLKTIAAYLNTEGGTLLIGVSDSGQIKGLDKDFNLCNKHDADGLEQKLRSLLAERFKPAPLGRVTIKFSYLSKDTICRIDVKPVPKPEVVHLDKDVYIRDGNVTRKLEGPDLTRWIAQRSKEQ